MQLVWMIGACVGGGAVGVALATWLRAGSWRLPTEPAAAAVPWVAPVLAAVWALLVWRLGGLGLGSAWPAYAVLAALGCALAAIDLQVHRLPDLLTLGGLPVVATLLAASSLVESDWHRLSIALWSAGLALLIFGVLVLGGLGLGDLKLAVLLGLALGWLGLSTALLGLLAGFVLGGLWAASLLARGESRTTRFAYGPWMLLGALLAMLAGSA